MQTQTSVVPDSPAREREDVLVPRPAKRPRPTPSSRGPSACQRCRDRKTKCDFRYPACGPCMKRQIPCVYHDETEDQHVTGAEIMEAISTLSKLVKSQHEQTLAQVRSAQCSPGPWSQPIAPGIPERQSRLHPSCTQGLESVLGWDIFQSLRPVACLFAEEVEALEQTLPPPPLRYSELLRLKNKYIEGIHDKNPFLDLDDLHVMLMNVAENGPDWSTETCLVSLVCALGAITQSYTAPAGEGSDDRLDGMDSEQYLARQFFFMGVKRLGLAIGANDMASTQCLCLAGIWYMHNLRPLDAWKHFNLAESSRECLRLTNKGSGTLLVAGQDSPRSFTLWQSLYFTLWKSQCELMFELPVTSREFDSSQFGDCFPTPPTPSAGCIDGAEAAQDERRWYYYLAEIAARHLMNRIVQTNHRIEEPLTTVEIEELLRKADAMEVQVENWYSSLPLMFQFEVPNGFSLEPHPDDMTQILRNRYLTMREIIGRQFVRICVQHSLEHLDVIYRSRVLSLASQSVRFCMIKLSQVKPHRHQGTWFMLRNATTSSLVLCAVHLAKHTQWRTGAHDIMLPDGWQGQIQRAHDQIGPYWSEPHGGSRAIQNALQICLAACSGDQQLSTPTSGSVPEAHPHMEGHRSSVF